MNPTLEKKDGNQSKWLLLGTGYALLVMSIVGYVNYIAPYDGSPVVYPTYQELLLWTLLYIPLLFPTFAKWQVKELGFSINPSVILASIFFAFLCTFIKNVAPTWYGTFAEAYSRT